MTNKQIAFQQEARQHMLAGVNAIDRAVRVTLGPRGRNVLFDKGWDVPTSTKDGATVAKEVTLPDTFQNMCAQLIREVATKTAEEAGDGTTTATVLAAAIMREGIRLVTSGHDPVSLRRGIDKAVAAIVDQLAKASIPASGMDAIRNVGTIASNGDESVGRLLAEAMEKVGQDGVITFEEAQSREDVLEIVEGMQIERGFLSPYFVTDVEKQECVLENALILFHEKPIHALRDMLPLLQEVARQSRPLLIVAEDVGGDALSTLVVNRIRGSLACAAVKSPGFGNTRRELLEDLAIVTGGQVLSEDAGLRLDKVTIDQLGSAKKLIIEKDLTTVIGGGGDKDAIEKRCEHLRKRLEDTERPSDRDELRKRLARLSGGVAILRIGASTESEMKERQDRVEDAFHATRAAVEEGIVPGGGVALLRAQSALDGLEEGLPSSEGAGVAIVRRAITEPLRRIAENAGAEGAVVVGRVLGLAGNSGFNARTGEYEDLIKAGVIDPTKVVRMALQNAASVAGVLLTTEAMVPKSS